MSLMVTFTSMYDYISSAIDSAVSGFGSGLVSFVAAPLGVAATVYFLLLGFAVLRARSKRP
jgi:type IV secretion system protein VirB6